MRERGLSAELPGLSLGLELGAGGGAFCRDDGQRAGHNTMDLDQWLEKVKGGNYLLEDELKQLCEYVSDEAGVWW